MTRNMMWFLSLLFFLQMLPKVKGNCKVDNITDWTQPYVNTLIKDTERNTFHNFKTKNVVEVKVEGADMKKYVHARIDKNNVIVYPSKDFENYERDVQSTDDPKIVINLKFKCQNNNTKTLVFYQPIQDVNTYTPMFTQMSYVFTLPTPLPPGFVTTDIGQEIIACDWDISNKRLNFSLKFAENLTVEWHKMVDKNLKCHQAVLKVTHWFRFSHDQFFQMIATDEGTPQNTGRAFLIIKIYQNDTLPFLPTFEFSYYKARYVYTDTQHYFYIHDPIKLVNSNLNARIRVSEDYKKFFSTQLMSDLVCVSLIKQIDKNFLMNNSIIFITLEVYLNHTECTGRTILGVYLVNQQQGSSGSSQLTFEQNNYWFQVSFWYYGVLGFVKAFTKPFLHVTYSLESSDGFAVPKQLTIDTLTGRLSLKNALRVGVYQFIVTASESTHQLETHVNVIINVEGDTMKLQTKNSVMVIHVVENEVTKVKLPCQYDFALCIYEVIDQYPLTNPLLFSSSMGNLLIAAVDRENDEIMNMSVPQYIVQLRIVELTYIRDKRDLNYREWINVPKTVHHEIDHLLLSVIIDDINDNPPLFADDTATIVGYYYSNSSLPFYIPITHIQANDADLGSNADITYAIDNENFIIHPKTGLLYPRSKSSTNQAIVNILITATDRNGTGLCSVLNLTIVPLKLENLLLISTNNASKNMLNTLSNLTNLSVQALPTFSYQEYLMNTTIVIYALDNEVPVGNVMLEKKLAETELQVQKPYSVTLNNTLDSSCVAVRKKFVIAITVIGTILVVFVIAVFVSSFCRYQNRKNDQKKPSKPEAQSIEFSISSDDPNFNLENEKPATKTDPLKNEDTK